MRSGSTDGLRCRAMSSPDLPPTLVGLINRSRVLPFLGAGASMDPPSDLPSAQQLADQLSDQGFGRAGDSLEDVAEYCYQASGSTDLFAKMLPLAEWELRTPNDMHVLVAELGAEGLITYVLTTNWDNMVEHAMERAGVLHVQIARAADLATAPPDAVKVVKLHGSSRLPETLSARKADVEAEDWAADWAAALSEHVIQSHEMLFVGYSGSSAATTKTIAKLVAGGRTGPDFIVSPSGYEGLTAKHTGQDLIDALQATATNVTQATAVQFADSMRDALYPLLLTRARVMGTALAVSLTKDTSVSADWLAKEIGGLCSEWVKAGRVDGRKSLAVILSCPIDKYVPLVPNAKRIAEIWMWLGLAQWAGILELPSRPGEPLRPMKSNRGQLVLVSCPDDLRRDQCAYATVRALSESLQAPSVNARGFLWSGLGPPPPKATAPLSMVRGEPTPDVVRGGATSIDWQVAPDLTQAFGTELSAEEIRGGIAAMFSDSITNGPTDATNL